MLNHATPPFWKVFGDRTELQRPYDVAVVMPSIGRPEIVGALSSVFRQSTDLRLQVLIGIDKPLGNILFIDEFLERTCPKNVNVNIIYPGYSTSVRHGGVSLARDGGALRSVLTQMANSRYVAYLDDDNWWGPTHLVEMLGAIHGKAWAFTYRYFVHPVSKKVVCIDQWESVGPGKGIFREKFGGFVDPNCLMLDKEQSGQCVPMWSTPLPNDPTGMTADRSVFDCLNRHGNPGSTGKATSFYVMNPNDGLHPVRIRIMGDLYVAAG